MLRGWLGRAGRAAALVTIPVAIVGAAFVTQRLATLNAFYRPADSWLLWGYLSAALGLVGLPVAAIGALLAERTRPGRAGAGAFGALVAVVAAFEARCASGGHWGPSRLLIVALGTWIVGTLAAARLDRALAAPRLRRGFVALLGVAVLGLFVARLPRAPGERPAAGPPPVLNAPPRRVLLVGFDGLDPGILDRLMARGDMPTFRRLADEGYLARSRTLSQTLSPIIWTTIATGKRPEEHGILGFLAYRLAGMDCALQRFAEADGCGTGLMTWALDGARRLGLATRWPVTSNLRRVRTLWEILSERGLRVAVVDWWATWPAERVRGVLVSDRFHHAAMESAAKLTPASLLTYPGSESSALAALVVRPADLAPDEVHRLFEPDPQGSGGRAEQVKTHESLNDWSQGRDPMLLAFLSSDRTYANVAARLLEKREWDFAAVYFRGIDVASHLTGAFSRLHGRAVPGRVAARYAGTLEAYYRLADAQLAELLARAGDDVDVIVCSDHGFAFEPDHGFNHVETAPDGVFLLHGPDAAQGRGRAAVEDVTPTVLRLLDQPVARDMQGRVLEEAFATGSAARQPPAWIATYEGAQRLLGRAAEGQDDEKIHEELRALGYVN